MNKRIIKVIVIAFIFYYWSASFMIVTHNLYQKVSQPSIEPRISFESYPLEEAPQEYNVCSNYQNKVTNKLSESYTHSLDIDGTLYYFTDSQWSDINHIARIVYAESGNQPYEGRHAVASVIMNRVTCDYYSFGEDVVDVLSAPKQFDTWKNSRYYKEPTDENIEISAKAYIGIKNLPDNVLFFCTYYYPSGWGTYPYHCTIEDVSFYTYG